MQLFRQLTVIAAILKALRKMLIVFELTAARAEIIRAVSLVHAIRLTDNEYLRRVVMPTLPFRKGQQYVFPCLRQVEEVSLSSLGKSFTLRMQVLRQLGHVYLHVRACLDQLRSVARLACAGKGLVSRSVQL